MLNRRLQPRIPIKTHIEVYLQDVQKSRPAVRASAINVSRCGILVQSEKAIATGTVLYLQAWTGNLAGKAVVRSCNPHGRGYRIGMYFPDPLMSRSLLNAYSGDVNRAFRRI
jgi:PilZ domain